MNGTYSLKASEIHRDWWIVDATDLILGRVAARAAHVLRGKHKPTFAPHLDNGDHVVIINAAKIKLSGNKAETKIWYRHSGYPGGLREISYKKLLATRPETAVEKAVVGMLPHNRLGRSMSSKLKVYPGPEHPHAAQQPKAMEIA